VSLGLGVLIGVLATTSLLSSAQASSSARGTRATTRGGALVIARNLDAVDLNPYGTDIDNGSIFVMHQIYDTLVRASPSGTPAPDLAKSWKVSSNGLTWTFSLRAARFSNGDPVTAADVVFSLKNFMNPKMNTLIPSLAFGFKRVSAPNAHTVVVQLSHPVGALLDNLTVFPASILDAKMVRSLGTKYYAKPIGSGPFVVKDWLKGNHITLTRNTNYWKPGQPYLDSVRFEYVPDDNARMLRIKAGSADIAEGVPFSQIKSLKSSTAFHLDVQPIARLEAVFPNDSQPPFNDINVRKALNYATDRNAINQAVYGGVAEATHSMLPKSKYYNPAVPGYDYNLAKAKEYMAKSSVPHGFNATLVYPAGSSIHSELSTILQAEWQAIGVTLKLQSVDGASLWNQFLGGKYQIAMPLPQWTADVTVPDENGLQIWTNDPNNGFRAAGTRWTVPQKLISVSTAAATTTSESRRASLWRQQQALAMSSAPWIPLFTLPSVTAVRGRVHGFRTLPAAWYDLEDVWVSK
jgi:peptide/nickel transport system substrate-binding protein